MEKLSFFVMHMDMLSLLCTREKDTRQTITYVGIYLKIIKKGFEENIENAKTL